jgi:hypothetical protein
LTRPEIHIGVRFERNILYWRTGPLFDRGRPWPELSIQADHNLCCRTEDPSICFGDHSLSDWQAKGQDAHSVVAAALFRDPDRGDFSLDPNTPAFTLGFKPIDLSTVGPRKSGQ